MFTVSTWLIWWSAFLNTVSFAIIIPSTFEYMNELHAPSAVTGVAVGLFPFGKIIFNPFSSWFIERKGFKAYMVLSSLSQISGNVVYALAGATGRCWVALFGRFLVGALGGQLLTISYVVRVFTGRDQAPVMLFMQNAQTYAYVTGTLCGGFLELVCRAGHLDGIIFNKCTIPAWLTAFMSVVLLARVILSFDGPGTGQGGDSNPIGADLRANGPCFRLGFPCAAVLAAQSTVASWEVRTSKFTQSGLGWPVVGSGVFLSAVVLLSVPINRWLAERMKHVQERDAIFALVLCTMPCTILLTLASGSGALEVALYSVGSLGLVSCEQATAPLAKALFSVMTHESTHQRGIELISIFSAIGRSIGPIVGSSLETNSTYGLVLSIIAFAMLIGTVYLYPGLVNISTRDIQLSATMQSLDGDVQQTSPAGVQQSAAILSWAAQSTSTASTYLPPS